MDVERVFSRGRFTLPYVQNWLSVQSTQAQLCVGNWSLHGYVHNSDVLTVSRLPDVEGDVDVEFEEGWDKIILKTADKAVQRAPNALPCPRFS